MDAGNLQAIHFPNPFNAEGSGRPVGFVEEVGAKP
jgi:hypothetical protein